MEFKKKTYNLSFVAFSLILACTPSALSAPLCSAVFEQAVVPAVDKVAFSNSQFDQATNDLRSTLSGKLATVWRSEWKTKLNVSESNRYVLDLLTNLLTTETRAVVLQDLDVNNEGFARQVHARIFGLQAADKIKAADDLLVRDMPSPKGAKDTTFTYYTKPLINGQGDGKHQMRIRTYLREVFYEQIPLGKSVKGFDAMGRSIEILRFTPSTYKINISQNDTVQTASQTTAQSSTLLTADQMKERFGKSAHIFAPHGKKFKLEVKTALNDEISSDRFPLLGGKHMVQKLDVSLSLPQVTSLFAPLKAITSAERIQESLNRIDKLVEDLNAKDPDGKSRTHAVFNVVKEGIQMNSDFLVIEGATFYHRTAFESRSGFQTTIDRDQGVYAGQMYDEKELRSPLTAVKLNQPLRTGIEDARHVELKVPVTSIQNTAGIKFYDPKTAPEPLNVQNDAQIIKVEGIYHNYVKNSGHAGKFNYMRKNGEAEHDF